MNWLVGTGIRLVACEAFYLRYRPDRTKLSADDLGLLSAIGCAGLALLDLGVAWSSWSASDRDEASRAASLGEVAGEGTVEPGLSSASAPHLEGPDAKA